MTDAVAVIGLKVEYETKRVFSNFDAEFVPMVRDNSHYLCALMGPSGVGKTTLLHVLAGLLRPAAGKVENSAESLGTTCMVTQRPILLESLSIVENARLLSRVGAARDRFDERLFLHLIELLSLGDLFRRRPPTTALSGGEAQRLGLLRALSVRPTLLLLDEPTTGLDPELRWQFRTGLLACLSEIGSACVYVTHHVNEVGSMADRVMMLQDGVDGGRISGIGTLDELQKNPTSLPAYELACDTALLRIRATIVAGSCIVDGTGVEVGALGSDISRSAIIVVAQRNLHVDALGKLGPFIRMCVSGNSTLLRPVHSASYLDGHCLLNEAYSGAADSVVLSWTGPCAVFSTEGEEFIGWIK